MDFFNKLGKKASETYQVTKEKTVKFSEEMKLKGKINDANTVANIGQVKREHQELCRKCDALRKTRKICAEQMEDCKKCRDRQNVITAQRRDYIGKNFGKKGKQWRNRIMAKHKR